MHTQPHRESIASFSAAAGLIENSLQRAHGIICQRGHGKQGNVANINLHDGVDRSLYKHPLFLSWRDLAEPKHTRLRGEIDVILSVVSHR